MRGHTWRLAGWLPDRLLDRLGETRADERCRREVGCEGEQEEEERTEGEVTAADEAWSTAAGANVDFMAQ